MAIGTGAAILGGAILGGMASKSAANTQAGAADRAGAIQQQAAQEQLALEKRIYEEGVARQQPWLQAGTNALTQMQGGAFQQPKAFSFGAGDYQRDPGYAFRLSEGQKALERSAAARGGLISGSALKAAQRFGQDMGSQEYQNAYNRALTGYNANVARADTGYNRLAALAGVGQTATQQLGAAGQNYANQTGNTAMGAASNIGNAMGAAGQARASGYMGMANAASGGIGQYMGYQQNQASNSLLQQMLNQNQYNQSMQLVNSDQFTNMPAYMIR